MIDWLDHLGSPAGGLLAAGAILLAAFAAGRAMIALLPRGVVRHPLDAAVVATSLGVGGTSLLLLVVGTFVLPARPVLIAVVGAGALTGGAILALDLARNRALRRRVGRPMAWAAAALLLSGPLGGALCFPVGWDELTYHVELPARWLAEGKLGIFADNPYSGFPSGAEVLYTLGLGLGGVTAPRALAVAAWALATAATYRLVRRRLPPGSALALTAALAWSPVALMVVSETYVEGFLLLHVATALLVLRPRRPGAIGLAALSCAFAASVKLTGILAAPLVALATWPALRRAGRAAGGSWRGVVALLAAVPSYARPWLATGNPFHPYYARFFVGHDAVAVAVSEHFHAMARGRYGVHGIFAPLVTPVLLAGSAGFEGTLGWQWLVVLGLAGIGAWRSGPARALVLAAAAAYAAWLTTSAQLRLFLPGALFLAVAGAHGLARMAPRLRRTTAALVAAATLASIPAARWAHFYSTYEAGLGVGARPRVIDYVYTGTGNGYLPAAAWLLDHASPADRVLLFADSRGLYVPRAHALGTPLLQSMIFTPPESFARPEDVLASLQGHGIHFVILGAPRRDPDVLADVVERSRVVLDALRELEASGGLRRTWQDDGYVILEVRRP